MASATIHDKLGSGPGNGGARLIVGVILGFGITLFLFWLMQYMIETADRSLDEGSRGSLVDFVPVGDSVHSRDLERLQFVKQARADQAAAFFREKQPQPQPEPVPYEGGERRMRAPAKAGARTS